MSLWFLIAAIATLLLHQLFFDMLVSREYQFAKDDWIRDGSPRGFSWRAPEQGFFAGGAWARIRVMNSWLWKKPPWIREPSSRRLLFLYRATAIAFWVVIADWLIAAALRS